MNNGNGFVPRVTGLLIIEVINSNPNGDPDRESDPRQRPDERGEISPVSFKRKVRDLIEDKQGPVWQRAAGKFDPRLEEGKFAILETRDRSWQQVKEEIKAGTFLPKYWDARFFGNTFLEKDLSDQHIRTGACQFGLGVSIAPIRIERLTTTKKTGAQEGLERGMAPLAYRIVEHGVYAMPFFISASTARKSGCTAQDVRVLQEVIPFAYSENPSYIRSSVCLRHAWYAEHKSPLGSVSDSDLLAALTPKKKSDPETPSKSWSDYEAPSELPEAFRTRLANFRDLMADAYAPAGA